MTLQAEPWQQRVIEECEALETKIEKLMAFLVTPRFNKLTWLDQSLARAQLFHMEQYRDVLRRRIRIFSAQL